jgi:hypothetical protein
MLGSIDYQSMDRAPERSGGLKDMLPERRRRKSGFCLARFQDPEEDFDLV